jgi:hypothetical protein
VPNKSANIANPRVGKHNLEVIFVMRLELAAAQFDSGLRVTLTRVAQESESRLDQLLDCIVEG